jgi:SAM-dependent methyltransferase/uncharacterized protein YbaR (Trm112 family)
MEAWNMLASPTGHGELSLHESRTNLVDAINGQLFPIIDGIPLLLPKRYIADCVNNVLEVIYLDRAFPITQEIIQKHGQDGFQEAMRGRIKSDLGKLGVQEAFERYSRLPVQKRLECFFYNTLQDSGGAEVIVDKDTLSRSREYKSSKNGEKRFKRYRDALRNNPMNLPDYARAIAQVEPRSIVELGCGSGFGSCAVIDSLSTEQIFFPIDVDYACTANCIGIRKWLSRKKAIYPVVASFWFLPFPDKSIDVVCSHCGVDETREVPRVLEEAARVLKNGGKFIAVSRTGSTGMLQFLLDDLGFSHEELCRLASQARLYAGQEDLTKLAAEHGFSKTTAKPGKARDGVKRTLFIFGLCPEVV